MVMAIVVLFVGCGKAESPLEAASKEAAKDLAATQPDISSTGSTGEIKDLSDYMAAQQKIGEAYDENDPEAVAKMMEAYAELGAEMELREFEEVEAVDAPSDFPPSLIYGKGKITSSSDSGDESYINKSITIETTESLKTVKDFYKNLFSQPTWDLTSQSSESDGASYDATDSAGIEASVYIYADTYSKLVSIDISYSGYITE